jgi:hypothetical protein
MQDLVLDYEPSFGGTGLAGWWDSGYWDDR